MRRASMLFFCACWVVAVASFGLRAGHPSAQPQAPAPVGPAPVRQASGQASGQALPPPSEQALVKQYCVTCHNARTLMGGLSLETLDPAAAASHSDVWEKVAMKLRAGMMPPVGMPRPDEATLQGFAASLEQRIDGQALRSPDPGHKTEVKEALAEAISDLPEREKLVVTLYYYEELTLREIGEVLGVTE